MLRQQTSCSDWSISNLSLQAVPLYLEASPMNICLQLSEIFLCFFLLPCSQWRVSSQPTQGPHGLLDHRHQLRHRLPVPPGRPETRPADAGRPPHAQRPGHSPRWRRHRGRLSPGSALTAAAVLLPQKGADAFGTSSGQSVNWRCIEAVFARILPKEGRRLNRAMDNV